MAVHGGGHRKADDERVGKGREGKESDHPVERGVFGERFPEEESGQGYELLKRIGGEEFEIDGEEVAGGDHFEGQKWDGQDSHEAADSGGLLGGEEVEPPDGNVGDRQREVHRDDCAENVGDVFSADHG